MDGIKTFRKRISCNQQELADKLKISGNTVSQWESGTRKPSYEVLKQLLSLGATVEELFGIDCRGSCPHAAQDAPTMPPLDLQSMVEAEVQRALKNALEHRSRGVG